MLKTRVTQEYAPDLPFVSAAMGFSGVMGLRVHSFPRNCALSESFRGKDSRSSNFENRTREVTDEIPEPIVVRSDISQEEKFHAQ
jgi:hypothetical protein